MKIGSLFDGSGGFPLAATMCNVEPVWASEIEPFPIAVTRSRFPNMKHLGDISKINGGEVEPVDIITFGSPCQDLSVAGKRAGLKHEDNGDDETTRSGLFMEAVRIIKEMRNATNGKYPRYAVWENVPGAFSSNKGKDFRIVLEELVRISEPTAVMPKVPKGGWAYADVYCGNGWSLAYRVLDAQHWGVPQRRRRIYLVADFGGQRAGKILFEREGLRGHFAEGGTPWERLAGDVGGGAEATDCDVECVTISSKQQSLVASRGLANTLGANDYKEPQAIAYTVEPGIAAREGGHIYEGVSGTLRAEAGDNRMAVAYEWHSQDLRAKEITDEVAPTIPAAMGMGGANMTTPMLIQEPHHVYSIENHPADSRVNIDDSGKVQTLTSRMGTGGGNVPMVMEPVAYNGENITSPQNKTNPQPGDPCHTLGTDSRNYVVCSCQTEFFTKITDIIIIVRCTYTGNGRTIADLLCNCTAEQI